MAKIAKKSSQDGSIARGLAQTWLKKGTPGSQHSGGIGTLGVQFDQYLGKRAFPVGEYRVIR